MLLCPDEFHPAPLQARDGVHFVTSEFGGMMPDLLGAIFIDTRMRALRGAMAGLPHSGINGATYEGIGIRMSRDGASGRVELCHRDTSLMLALTDWLEPEQATLVWQSWARRLCLPMLLIQPEGETTIIRKANTATRVRPRRYGSPTRKRRSRFQAQRRPGECGEMPVFREAREVMSWE